MFTSRTRPCLLLLLLILFHSSSSSLISQRVEAIRMAISAISTARSSASAMMDVSKLGVRKLPETARPSWTGAWADCSRLYEDGEGRLRELLVGGHKYNLADALTLLSAAMTGHSTCMEGLQLRPNTMAAAAAAAPPSNVAEALRQALALHALPVQQEEKESYYNKPEIWNSTLTVEEAAGLLDLWDINNGNADLVVAQDGSGNYKTINDAVAALRNRPDLGSRRLVIYIKSGVYRECVQIDRRMTNLMFVGAGIDQTVITGNRNVPDGYTTFSSATFSVSGDNFWARDITFENTAGPWKHQAVAATVAADHAVFYRCSFKGYQDTLFVHSLRQFYRDCQVHGTIDFIFGNAAAVLQNCDIYVRKPMDYQKNMITAQGRDDPNQNTGISIHASRVRPAGDLAAAQGSFKSYLGRPWKRYSRTVFLKTDLDGLVDPEGWARWNDGDFALDTLFYGEYMNTGEGACIGRRVHWPGFHILGGSDAAIFTVASFLQGSSWISQAGVPFWEGL